MSLGVVIDSQATYSRAIRDSQGRDVLVEFVVDTGFAGYLTLPQSQVTLLSLPFRETISATLASDHQVDVEVFRAEVNWLGLMIEVDVIALGSRPLLGTGMLGGTQFSAQFVQNGSVSIVAI